MSYIECNMIINLHCEHCEFYEHCEHYELSQHPITHKQQKVMTLVVIMCVTIS